MTEKENSKRFNYVRSITVWSWTSPALSPGLALTFLYTCLLQGKRIVILFCIWTFHFILKEDKVTDGHSYQQYVLELWIRAHIPSSLRFYMSIPMATLTVLLQGRLVWPFMFLLKKEPFLRNPFGESPFPDHIPWYCKWNEVKKWCFSLTAILSVDLLQ